MSSHFLYYSESEDNYTYLYGYCVYNQLQNINLRCQRKQMHRNYFRISTALCHLTAVLVIFRQLLKDQANKSYDQPISASSIFFRIF